MNNAFSSVFTTIISSLLALLVFLLYQLNTKIEKFEKPEEFTNNNNFSQQTPYPQSPQQTPYMQAPQQIPYPQPPQQTPYPQSPQPTPYPQVPQQMPYPQTPQQQTSTPYMQAPQQTPQGSPYPQAPQQMNNDQSQNNKNNSSDELSAEDNPRAEKDNSSYDVIEYKVKSGDTLSKIAKQADIDIEQIISLNKSLKKNPNSLEVGQKIILPVN